MKTLLQLAWQRRYTWLGGLLLVLPAYGLWQSLDPVFPPAWPQQQAGPFRVDLAPADEAPPYGHAEARLKDFSARFCDGCVAHIRMAWLSVGPAPGPLPSDLAGVLHGHGPLQHAHAPFPSRAGPQDRLWLSVEDWQGRLHHAAWPLPPGIH